MCKINKFKKIFIIGAYRSKKKCILPVIDDIWKLKNIDYLDKTGNP